MDLNEFIHQSYLVLFLLPLLLGGVPVCSLPILSILVLLLLARADVGLDHALHLLHLDLGLLLRRRATEVLGSSERNDTTFKLQVFSAC